MTTENLKLDRETVLKTKLEDLKARQARTPIQAVIALATMQHRPRPILSTVSGGHRVQLIGQIRRTETYDPVASALQYVRAGVDAVSFYTDESQYQGDLDDMRMVATGVRTTPIIYQNYILNDYHVVEARAADASALLLYSSVLDRNMLWKAMSVTMRWKMSAIVQVGNEEQLQYANELSPHAVAIGDAALGLNGQESLALLERLRPQVTFNMRVLMMHCVETLEEAEAAIHLGVDALIVDQHLLGNPGRAAALHQLAGLPED